MLLKHVSLATLQLHLYTYRHAHPSSQAIQTVSAVAIQTVIRPAISLDQDVLQADKNLPRLRNHLSLADDVQKLAPTDSQSIRRRGSFILEYALCQTTPSTSPAPQRTQISAKQKTDSRQPILSSDWDVATCQWHESVYISAIIRNTDIILPRQYKLSPLAERIYQVNGGAHGSYSNYSIAVIAHSN